MCFEGALFLGFREIPNYVAIHNKMNDYQTMTRGEVADHLVASKFKNPSLKGSCATEVVRQALVSSLFSVVVLGLAVGGTIALAGGLNVAKIFWSVSGGIAIVGLAVAGCAAITRCYYRSQLLDDDEFNQLMEEIVRVKADDINLLSRKIENNDRITKSYQASKDNFEKLDFKRAS